jgi:hypothetical protein
MTMPGFVAEAALDRTHGRYQTTRPGGPVRPLIVPQWSPGSMCLEYDALCLLGHPFACAGALGCALGYEIP